MFVMKVWSFLLFQINGPHGESATLTFMIRILCRCKGHPLSSRCYPPYLFNLAPLPTAFALDLFQNVVLLYKAMACIPIRS